MSRIGHLAAKETLLLLRDWHALLLLFLMPAAFILVMSLALQGQFSARSGVHIDFYLLSHDSGATNAKLLHELRSLRGFRVLPASADADQLAARVRAGKVQFLVTIPAGFGAALATAMPKPVDIVATPDVPPAVYQLFQARLRATLARLYLTRAGGPAIATAIKAGAADKLLSAHTLYGRGHAGKLPSSVQQNVPAWLLFAMFFIAIPLSTTWVAERQQGTYARLLGMGIKPATLLIGKLIPYLVLNLVQVVLMLLVGVYLVPLLGGGQLTLGHAWGALALMAIVASLAAVSYALLVANLVSTSEQATIFTGVANLLMAAVGGIMVPVFIMPHALQTLSHYSPMQWGLQGFLDIFLRGGGIGMAWNEAAKLVVFAFTCLLATGLWMHWRRAK
ncbi:MAG TPA: ABC transporter permease [Rhodanobacteraceae bacterium]